MLDEDAHFLHGSWRGQAVVSSMIGHLLSACLAGNRSRMLNLSLIVFHSVELPWAHWIIILRLPNMIGLLLENRPELLDVQEAGRTGLSITFLPATTLLMFPLLRELLLLIVDIFIYRLVQVWSQLNDHCTIGVLELLLLTASNEQVLSDHGRFLRGSLS